MVPSAKSIGDKQKNHQDVLCIDISSTQSGGIALTIRAIRAMLDLSGQIRAMLFQIAEICIDVAIDGGRCRFLLGRGQPQLFFWGVGGGG